MRRSWHRYLFVTHREMVLILPCLDYYVMLYTQVSSVIVGRSEDSVF